MKKILQAAALILLTASVVFAAAHSSKTGDMTCHREWDTQPVSKKVEVKKNHYADNYGVEEGLFESTRR